MKHQVEVYIGYTDHTWDTMMINLESADMLTDKGLEIAAIKEAECQLSVVRDDVAFIGVYHIPPFEEGT